MQQPSLLQGKGPVKKLSWQRNGYIHENPSLNRTAIFFPPGRHFEDVDTKSQRTFTCLYAQTPRVFLARRVDVRGPFPPYLNANQYIPVKGQNLPNNLSDIVQAMVENSSATDERNGSVITEDEAELYDRQIRLWGLDAQKR